MNDMYKEFNNSDFSYYTPSSFDNRVRTYLLDRYSPRAIWNYMDTVSISFNLLELIDDEYLDDKDLILTFYNDRYEVMPITIPHSFDNETTVITFNIDYDTSCLYFKKGTYHCSIEAVKYDEEGSRTYSCMILSPNDCCFYVV